jgi:hypothetical protein
MPTYAVDFDYDVRIGDTTTVVADDKEQAEDFALEYAEETFTDGKEFEVVHVREVDNTKNG